MDEVNSFKISQELGEFKLNLTDRTVLVGQSLTVPIDYSRVDTSIGKLINVENGDTLPFMM